MDTSCTTLQAVAGTALQAGFKHHPAVRYTMAVWSSGSTGRSQPVTVEAGGGRYSEAMWWAVAGGDRQSGARR